MPPAASIAEAHAALLQAAITVGLALLCALFYRRYGKPYFLWWAVAWTLYLARLGAIITFLATNQRVWLFAHQVITGWTALALLWAAVHFSRQARWRTGYWALVLFPPLWAGVAIYGLHQFLLAAGPAVLFLSLATLWTAFVFFRYQRRTASAGALFLTFAFLLWGLHHLDYPLLRARGAWSPWGYYLDILFELAVGAGIVVLVLEDIHRGLNALAALAGDVARGTRGGVLEALLQRPLSLRGVRGSAMYVRAADGDGPGGGRFLLGIGACSAWTGTQASGTAARTIAQAMETGRPAFAEDWEEPDLAGLGGGPFAYAAVLPVFRHAALYGAMVIVGDARDPFTALDESFLLALGQQAGTALENADLDLRLQARTAELERLSIRMIRQYEEQRRRLSLELHDETAQLFSSVKMQLGVLREQAQPEIAGRLDRALELIDAGILSIRGVTDDLRPSLLDDLGLTPALRSLVAEFGERSGLETSIAVDPHLPVFPAEAELAIFRAVQEGLSNIARHAQAHRVDVRLGLEGDTIVLRLSDDGRGFASQPDLERLEHEGHMGLAGMRERITALGGEFRLHARPGHGVALEVRVPLNGDGNA